ncbi:MAG: hypothetical protein J0I86_06180 [Mesorhizobium sp.]|jgi:hypothetical protein|uniref:hypothetical protein n=1 Tax=Mesorhizobium sp. Root552 TaxID=1736555 RepID=UPI0006F3DC02|nr:hypothetical protein [Mesorhizobium sp. Root552]KQZ22830.1 hypothetical protein ASD50_21070 [Mesorhizobium sp. Root552]MBN9250159.1 hypothetical protein [Mesorhizobium sp.]
MADGKPDIKDELAYMAAHPQLFTKREMALMLAEAVEIIEMLRDLARIRREVRLDDVEPEGNA